MRSPSTASGSTEYQVTVGEFRRFVDATGYQTLAERPLDPADYPEADPELLVPGSLVFQRPSGPVPLDDYRHWWAYVPGASWRHPEGPGSDRGQRRSPGDARGVGGRPGLRVLGGQGAPDGGRVGVRGARRARGQRRSRGATSSRPAAG